MAMSEAEYIKVKRAVYAQHIQDLRFGSHSTYPEQVEFVTESDLKVVHPEMHPKEEEKKYHSDEWKSKKKPWWKFW